jgi:hypothetical protein
MRQHKKHLAISRKDIIMTQNTHEPQTAHDFSADDGWEPDGWNEYEWDTEELEQNDECDVYIPRTHYHLFDEDLHEYEGCGDHGYSTQNGGQAFSYFNSNGYRTDVFHECSEGDCEACMYIPFSHDDAGHWIVRRAELEYRYDCLPAQESHRQTVCTQERDPRFRHRRRPDSTKKRAKPWAKSKAPHSFRHLYWMKMS